MQKTAIRKVGNSLGVTLPKTTTHNLHLSEGDELFLIETPDGILLTPFDPRFSDWVKAYEKTNKKYRNALHQLAK